MMSCFILLDRQSPTEFEQKIIKEMDRMSLWFSPPPEEEEEEKSGNTSSSDSDNPDCNPNNDNATEVGSVGSLALKRNRKTSERPIRMLELCYIGLILLGEPVLCSDLIRFVEKVTI